jgi:hypothetical protein
LILPVLEGYPALMRPLLFLLALTGSNGALTAPPPGDPAAQWKLPMKTAQLTATERDAIFRAAGFRKQSDGWANCDGNGEGRLDDSWVDGGAIRDLNGDGRPEVVVVDSGTACHGMTGQGYTILTPTPTGWKPVESNSGIPTFLATRGIGGWQDIEIGGPGFCFPVLRWNGKEYAVLRHQYEGKTCKP